MALTDTLPPPVTIPDVDETTGQRIKRLRDEFGWTQVELAEHAGLSEATVGLLETDKVGKRGERPSAGAALAALERERQRRAGEDGPKANRQLLEFLLDAGEDVRVRRIGRRRNMRIVTVALPDPDATPDEISEALEEFHREQRRGDTPNG